MKVLRYQNNKKDVNLRNKEGIIRTEDDNKRSDWTRVEQALEKGEIIVILPHQLKLQQLEELKDLLEEEMEEGGTL